MMMEERSSSGGRAMHILAGRVSREMTKDVRGRIAGAGTSKPRPASTGLDDRVRPQQGTKAGSSCSFLGCSRRVFDHISV
jgi:hypothetical protein